MLTTESHMWSTPVPTLPARCSNCGLPEESLMGAECNCHNAIQFRRNTDEYCHDVPIGRYLGTVKLKFGHGKKRVMVLLAEDRHVNEQLIFIDIPKHRGLTCVLGDSVRSICDWEPNYRKVAKLLQENDIQMQIRHFTPPVSDPLQPF